MLTDGKVKDARSRWTAGLLVASIAQTLTMSRTTVYRVTQDLRQAA